MRNLYMPANERLGLQLGASLDGVGDQSGKEAEHRGAPLPTGKTDEVTYNNHPIIGCRTQHGPQTATVGEGGGGTFGVGVGVGVAGKAT